MAGRDLSALDVGSEGIAPDLQRSLVAGRQVELAPDEEARAGDGAVERAIVLVLLHVDAGPGAVVLAEGVDAARLVAALAVGGERPRIELVELARPRPVRHQHRE